MKIKGFLFKKARRTFSVAFFIITTFLFSSFVISNNVLAKTMKIGSSTTDISQVIGRMGIGTDNPGATLQINPAASTEGLRIISSNYSPFVIRNSANTADLFRIDQSGNIVGGNAGSWTLNGSNLYPVSTSYNVGIGTNSPITRLSVVSNSTDIATFQGANNFGYGILKILGGTANSPYWRGSFIGANIKMTSTYPEVENAGYRAAAVGFGSDTGEGHLGFFTTSATTTGSVLSEQMRILSNGNVGIGTTNPTQKLTVAGNVGFDTGKFTTDGSGTATFESFLDKSNVLYKLDPSNTGTSLNVAGSGVFGGDLTVNGGDITVNNNNGGVSFSDNSAYWLRTATSWGLYWDTSANQFKFNGGGATRASIDLDDGKAYFNGSVSADSFAAISASDEGLHILSPGGAKYQTNTSTITGAIKIVLPQSWTSTMMRMKVDIYEYAGSESFSVYLGGYNYSSGSWINTFAQIIGGKVNRDFTVRFGHDGTKAAIWIGEPTSTWSYPQVVVSDFYAGFNNISIDQWDDGWDIIFDTTFADDTITSTQSNNLISPWISNGTSIYNISSGNVGIGVTAPADKLHLGSGSLRISSLLNCSGTGQAIKTDSSGRLVCGSVSGGVTGSGATSSVARWTSASTLETGILYDNGTNVGVNTTAPAGKLHVNNGVVIIDKDFGIRGDGYNGSARNYIWALSNAYPDRGISYYEGSVDYVSIHPGGLTNVLAIADNGRVGVGTTAPTKVLDVNGDSLIRNAVTFSSSITASLLSGAAGRLVSVGADGTLGAISTASSGQTLRFNGSAWVPTSNLFNNGSNIGIGTSSPATRLDIYGGHSDTRMRLYANTGQTGVNSNSILSFWASEPSMTYNGAGIGENINGSPYSGIINSERMGTLIRFVNGVTTFERISTAGTRSESMRIDSSGNLGIGVSPSQKLQVAGNIYVNGSILAPEGTLRDDNGGWIRTYGATGWYSQSYGGGWYMTDSSWIRNYGSKPLYINGNGTTAASFMSGNVGIGTTNPVAKLEINSAGAFNPSVPGTLPYGLHFTSSATSGHGSGITWAGFDSRESQAGIYVNTSVGATNMYFATSDNFDPGAETKMTINSGGNVGIGTTNPGVRLEIANGVREGSLSGNSVLDIVGTAIASRTTNTVQDLLRLHQPNTASSDSKGSTFAIGISFPDDPGNNYPRTRVDFKTTGRTTDDADAGNTVMSLMDSGNVGIGTTAPLDKLHLGSGSLRISSLLNCSGTGQAVKTDSSGRLVCGSVSGGITGSGTTSYVARWTGTSTLGKGVLYDNGTNVGIGTTAPTNKLTIVDTPLTGAPLNSGDTMDIVNNGTVSLNMIANTSGDINLLFSDTTRAMGEIKYKNSDNSLRFRTNNVADRMIINSAGNVGIGTTAPSVKLEVNGDVKGASFTYTSDISYKKDVKTIKNPIAKIQALRGVTFNWKKDNTPAIGLIAQEVEKVFPEVVIGKEGNKGVSYGALVAPLIEAVKAQQEQIDSLRERIELLEKKN